MLSIAVAPAKIKWSKAVKSVVRLHGRGECVFETFINPHVSAAWSLRNEVLDSTAWLFSAFLDGIACPDSLPFPNPCIPTPGPRLDGPVESDTELARVYELEIETQYIPVNVYTREVDYPDVAVQVNFQPTEEILA